MLRVCIRMLKCVQRSTHNSTHVMVSDGREGKLGRKAGSQAGREAGGTRDHKRDNTHNQRPRREQVAEKKKKRQTVCQRDPWLDLDRFELHLTVSWDVEDDGAKYHM